MSDSKSKAISIIRAEHRALGAVINNIKALLQEVQAERAAMDFRLFWAMAFGLGDFVVSGVIQTTGYLAIAK